MAPTQLSSSSCIPAYINPLLLMLPLMLLLLVSLNIKPLFLRITPAHPKGYIVLLIILLPIPVCEIQDTNKFRDRKLQRETEIMQSKGTRPPPSQKTKKQYTSNRRVVRVVFLAPPQSYRHLTGPAIHGLTCPIPLATPHETPSPGSPVWDRSREHRTC